MNNPRRVLFVCTANSARSLMAEALLKDLAGDQFEVASAGTEPTQPHPLTLQCIKESGLDDITVSSKSVASLRDEHWDYVITLCDKAARECQPVTSVGQRIAWDFPDPVPNNRHATFMMVMKELKDRISLFVLVHQKVVHRPAHYPPAAVFKALGDENRLAAMLLILNQEELCVCELTVALDVSQPRISRYLGQLRDLALVEDERRGQWIYYRVHHLLPDWLITALTAASDENSAFLTPMTKRLTAMPNRPVKEDCV